METNKLFIKQGWQCPICKTIYNPYIISCSKCNNKNDYNYSDKTIREYNTNEDYLKKLRKENQLLKFEVESHLTNQNFIKDLNNSYLPYPPVPNEI